MTDADPRSRQMLADYTARYARPLALAHSTVAHRDLGFCSLCVRAAVEDGTADDGHPITDPGGFPARVELSAWRLLAMAERGMDDWTKTDAA